MFITRQGTKIQELQIADNNLTSVGLTWLFEALRAKNRSLRFLDVAGNTTDVGVLHALRGMLENNSRLRFLAVSDLYRLNDTSV